MHQIVQQFDHQLVLRLLWLLQLQCLCQRLLLLLLLLVV
jgi:hypothetical protein